MLQKLGGYELKVAPVKFEENDEGLQDYFSLTFLCEKTPELQGKTLVIGGFREQDNQLGFEAFFDGEPESDAMIKKHSNEINMIMLDIIEEHLKSLQEEDK